MRARAEPQYPADSKLESAPDAVAAGEVGERILSGLERVLFGKRPFLTRLLACLFAGGHVLIEDLPGLGKTGVAKGLAGLLSSQAQPVVFRRVQFTPDLLPYDITGVDVFDPDRREFVFSPGPVFANILLADELNRATPKVQSALLEVMAEHQVTVGGVTHRLQEPFFVIGTQNPVEFTGTYPLPLAQIDRFLMRLKIGYPSDEVELEILKKDPEHTALPSVTPVAERAHLLSAREAVRAVYVEETLLRAAVSISKASRARPGVSFGISPRGSLMLVAAARAYALLHGRIYVIDQDLIDLAPDVLAHRLVIEDGAVDARTLTQELAYEAVAAIHR